jgi:hypothetical protein
LYLWLYVIATVVNWHISREHKKFRLKMKKKKMKLNYKWGNLRVVYMSKSFICMSNGPILTLNVSSIFIFILFCLFFQRVRFRSTAQKVRAETTIVPEVSEVPVWMVPPCSAISNRIVQMLETKRNRFVVSY